MLAASEASGVLGAEGSQIAELVVGIAEKLGLDMIKGKVLADWFADTEFEDWKIDDADTTIKAAIREIIWFAKQQEKARNAPEDGELQPKGDGQNEEAKALQRLTEMFSKNKKTELYKWRRQKY